MPRPPQQGDTAPDFTMSTDGGGKVSLADFRGSSLILYFYPKDDTPGCTTEALDFTARIDDFRRAGARIVGVSPDGAARHDRFKAKHSLAFTLACDEDHAVALAYGVWTEKSMYGRKFMGIERSTFLIDGAGRIARAWPKVKVVGHAEEVLAAVRDAAGRP
jgi:thioredoxin-dependent peroxiredoxin